MEDLLNGSQENERPSTPPPPKKKSKRPKSAMVDEEKLMTEDEKHELQRKRDTLIHVAILDDIEHYTGEKLCPAKIRLMKRERIEALFKVYQAKQGQEVTENSMESVIGTGIKLGSFFVEFDDKEALKKDLMNNKQLRRQIGVRAADLTENYGDFVAWGTVLFDIVKHLKIPDLSFGSPEEENPIFQPKVINLDVEKKDS